MTATTSLGDDLSIRCDSAEVATNARLATIARELREALRALGATPELRRIIQEIPDSRERLSYVGDMTERAAHRVLTLVDAALPTLAVHAQRSVDLAARCKAGAHASDSDSQAPIEAMAAIADFADASTDFVDSQRRILGEIMLAQDFQDLSGQVIKSVIDMITRTERQLVQLLVDEADPDLFEPSPAASELQGPSTPEKALQQDDVDDLLASMGF